MNRQIKAMIALSIAAVCLNGQVAVTPVTQITGRVEIDSGAPIGNFPVIASLLPTYQLDSRRVRTLSALRVNMLTQSNVDGSFQFAGLPPGEYRLCATPNEAGYIGNCEWRRSSRPVSLTQGTTASIGALRVERGRRVLVRLADPRKRLGATSQLLVGVMATDGYYRRAELEEQTETSRQYVVTTPSNLDVSLFTDTDLTMSDKAARA